MARWSVVAHPMSSKRRSTGPTPRWMMSSSSTPAIRRRQEHPNHQEVASVKLRERAALPDDLASASPAGRQRTGYRAGPVRMTFAFVGKTLAIAEWEARKLLHDPTDILVSTVQPALWLISFGETFSRIRAIPTGIQSYLQFLAPGIL